jgi:hypothetical protein
MSMNVLIQYAVMDTSLSSFAARRVIGARIAAAERT